MNILDLGFSFSIKIEFDGDVDGGCYHLTIQNQTCTQNGTSDTQTTISVTQADIDEMHAGAWKLAKALEAHISEQY